MGLKISIPKDITETDKIYLKERGFKVVVTGRTGIYVCITLTANINSVNEFTIMFLLA